MQILLHLYLCPQKPTHGLCPHGLCPKVEDTTHVSPLRSLRGSRVKEDKQTAKALTEISAVEYKRSRKWR